MPQKEVVLSNGTTRVNWNSDDASDLYNAIISDILIPDYEKNNDWYAAISKAVKELEIIRNYFQLPITSKHQTELLHLIHEKLKDEIADLKGVDKIEILFLNMDDYVEEINKIIFESGDNITKESKVQTLGDLIAQLNTFELSELIYYYASRVKKE